VEHVIRPWQPADADAVIDMIVSIQQGEFGLPITAADQPDLADVDGFYRASGGEFWVADLDGKVVGTIAALGIGDGDVALRKMFVHADHRGGAGLSAQLMDTLLRWAETSGCRCIYLGTTAVMLAAHRFYAKVGFTRIDADDLPPTFPRMGVDSVFFRRNVA
jgi:GNAT superfamily N-acetyltransferase